MTQKQKRGARSAGAPWTLQPRLFLQIQKSSIGATVQPREKLRKESLLRQMEKLVEDFDEEGEVGKSVVEPGNEKEVDEATHRRNPSAAFRVGSKS